MRHRSHPRVAVGTFAAAVPTAASPPGDLTKPVRLAPLRVSTLATHGSASLPGEGPRAAEAEGAQGAQEVVEAEGVVAGRDSAQATDTDWARLGQINRCARVAPRRRRRNGKGHNAAAAAAAAAAATSPPPCLKKGTCGTAEGEAASRRWPARAAKAKAKAKAKARKGAGEVNAVVRRVWTGLREEHTLVNLFSPPENDESITEMQVVHTLTAPYTPRIRSYTPLHTLYKPITELQVIQVLWNTLALELVLICLFYEPEEEGEDEAEPIPLLQSLATGGIAAGITAAVVFFCLRLFRFGNARRLPPPREKESRLRKGVARAMAPLLRARAAASRSRKGGGSASTAHPRPSQLEKEVKAEAEQQRRREFYDAMAQRQPSTAALAAEAARKQVCP